MPVIAVVLCSLQGSLPAGRGKPVANRSHFLWCAPKCCLLANTTSLDVGCSEPLHPGQPPMVVPVGVAASSEPHCKPQRRLVSAYC